MEKITKLINDKYSLSLVGSKLDKLKSELSSQFESSSFNSGEEFYHWLSSDDDGLDTLVGRLTTKETFFFRIPTHFEVLGHKVLPDFEIKLSNLIQKALAENGISGVWDKQLKIWSTACSTGEEPYSIAMTVLKYMNFPKAWNVEIVATDISREAVSKAASARYERNKCGKIPKDYVE